MSIQNDHLMGIIRSCLCLPEDGKDYEIHFTRFINGNETVNSFCMNNTTDNRVVKKNPAFHFMDDNFMDAIYDNFLPYYLTKNQMKEMKNYHIITAVKDTSVTIKILVNYIDNFEGGRCETKEIPLPIDGLAVYSAVKGMQETIQELMF